MEKLRTRITLREGADISQIFEELKNLAITYEAQGINISIFILRELGDGSTGIDLDIAGQELDVMCSLILNTLNIKGIQETNTAVIVEEYKMLDQEAVDKD